MFGDFKPGVKNLLWQENIWTGINTFSYTGLNLDPGSKVVLENATPSTSGAQQVSPGMVWSSWGYKTSAGGGNQLVRFRAHSLPIQSVNNPDGVLKFQQSINGAAYSDLLDLYTRNPDGNPTGRMDFAGALKLNFNQGNQDPGTSRAIDLVNSAGSYTNIAFTFVGTIKSAITTDNTGVVSFKQVNNATGYQFMAGGSISGQSLLAQIYSGGFYTQGGGFFGGRVTAGQADTTPPATLNSYGSLALKYEVVTATTKTLDATHTFIYCDPSTSACGGTPSVATCTTYSASGQATCESHLPCVYNAAITTQCSTAGDNTDSTTCTSQDASCTWTTSACSVYDNNSSSCNAAGFPSPQCTFTAATCGDFTTTATCDAEAGNGCTTGTNPCSAFDNTDQATCEANVGCSYAGDPVCSGTYFASCTGTYTGPNGACSGTYDTGGCAGSWVSSAASCVGTVACSPYSSSGTCNAEAGCLWQALITVTLPTTATTNEGGTSRVYELMHVGSAGTVQINPNTGQDILNYTNLFLRTKGDKVKIQHVSATTSCSGFVSQGSCEAQSPCVWTAAIVCSDYNGNESACNAQSGAGCSYDTGTSICSGAGSAANCSGDYTSLDRWMPFDYERAKNYVAKTAAYTFTNEDDVVNYTSGTVALTLPLSASIVPTRSVKISNMGSGVITLNTTSSQLISGNASGTLTLVTGDSIELFPLSAGWLIV